MALIALGVTGGIGAYKAVEVARGLQKRGHDVVALMTRNARRFVGEVTFEAITRRRVITGAVDAGRQRRHRAHLHRLRHRAAARRAGDRQHHRQVRARHRRRLPVVALHRDDGAGAAGAGHEHQHAGAPGRSAEPARRSPRAACSSSTPETGIWRAAGSARGGWRSPTRSSPRPRPCWRAGGRSGGKRVVVTAGPTFEDLDPVRFVGNRSSGRMGYAIAAELAGRGADVTLVTGPTAIDASGGRVDACASARRPRCIAPCWPRCRQPTRWSWRRRWRTTRPTMSRRRRSRTTTAR